MKPGKEEQKRLEPLLTFLKLTKDGKYAKIEESSLSFIRLEEQRQEPVQVDYYYSIR